MISYDEVFCKLEKDLTLLLTWRGRVNTIIRMAETIGVSCESDLGMAYERSPAFDYLLEGIEQIKEYGDDTNARDAIRYATAYLQRMYGLVLSLMFERTVFRYNRSLEGLTDGQISKIFPEYFTDARPKFDRINEIIKEFERAKGAERIGGYNKMCSLECDLLEEPAAWMITENAADELVRLRGLLRDKAFELNRLKENVKKENKELLIYGKILPAIFGAIGGAAVAAIIMAIAQAL